MSVNEHQQASDLMPLFCAKEVHRALEHWGLGEEMLLGKASAELSRSRPIENHSKQIQARRTNEQCTNFKKSSVPTEQCAELNNTNRGGSYKSKAGPRSPPPLDLPLSYRFHWKNQCFNPVFLVVSIGR